MECVHVKNCRVIISTAEAPDLVDEVSSIAHSFVIFSIQMRFYFRNTREGIRLVARSISDQVNVAEIASAFKAAAMTGLQQRWSNNRDNPDQLKWH